MQYRAWMLMVVVPACATEPESIHESALACSVPPVAITHTAGSPNVARAHLLDLAQYPTAVCNDGTPGSYARRPGFGAGAKRWMIYLEGGGSCEEGDVCEQRFLRTPGLMSSRNVVDNAIVSNLGGGIKSTSAVINPDFYDVNLVQLNYCSSDGWSGNQKATPGAPIDDVAHWHFRGKAIVRAVIEEMLADGLDAGDEVLLLGSSAGGVGTANNADDVRKLLPASIRLVAVSDAGYIVDYPAYDPATKQESTARPTPPQERLALADAAWAGRGDASCVAAAPTDDERMLCRAPAAMLGGGHVKTPFLVRQSQLDPVQLQKLIPRNLPPSHDPAVKAFSDRFAAAMRAQQAALPAGVGTFSTYDNAHGIMNNDEEWLATEIDGVPVATAIGAFYRNPCQPPRLIDQP